MPKILKSVSEVRDFTDLYNLINRRIGFVPTMGALHEGHIELGRRARKECDCVIYSIFVNPIQFGKGEDLDKYPRDLRGDIEKLDSIGTDAVFIPENNTMYPENFSTFVDVGPVGDVLCGASRPGHFRGVATVVLKLFNIIGCDQAYFGKKDYQQYAILKKMVSELNLDTDIIGIDTVRENDGLAMSSRNMYLSPEERAAATVIIRALRSAKKGLGSFIDGNDLKEHALSILKKEKMAAVEYLELRNAESLSAVKDIRSEKLVLLAAVRFGTTRLIDNIELN